jgi:fatty acid elongase 3
VYYASYTYFTSTYFPWMPNSGNCAGEEFAAFAGMAILSSYLLLFISFYLATYKKAGKTGRPRRNTGRQAVIAMGGLEVPTVSGKEANGNAKTNGSAVSPRASRSRKA